MDANTFSAIADWVTTFGVSVAVWQLFVYKRELREDHDRSRRENAISLSLEWAKGLGRNGSLTRKLVELLDEEQVASLIALQPFSIAEEHCQLVLGCLQPGYESEKLKIQDGMVHLNESQVKIIKWQMVSYLNLLESILSAWRHNTADREMIEEQFKYLVMPENGDTIVEKYRRKAGGSESLPSITKFTAEIRKKRAEDVSRQQAEESKKIVSKPLLGR